MLPSPGACITGNRAGPALYFDQEDTNLGHDQEVDFVDRPIQRDEFKICPRPIGFVAMEIANAQTLTLPVPTGRLTRLRLSNV